MPLKYSCFISYRHGQYDLMKNITDDLYHSLSSELEALVDESVFIDRERIKGGNFFNEKVAKELCCSACMVMIYTPRYFSTDHSYCAREYKAMEYLEKMRLSMFSSEIQMEGLIIPVIFRGSEKMPGEIRERRHSCNFESYYLYESNMQYQPDYAPKVREIASIIADKTIMLKQLSDEKCFDCSNFSLPKESEIFDWLNRIQPSFQDFPLR